MKNVKEALKSVWKDIRSVQWIPSPMSLASLTTIPLVLLKLFGAIDWSWWFVLLPLYGLQVFAGGTLTLILFILYIMYKYSCIKEYLKEKFNKTKEDDNE